jgi:multiple sugar transport system substrate-binding protein
MMSARPKNEAASKKLLQYISQPEAQLLALKADPSVIATNSTADTSGYTALQKKSLELVKSAKSITQFMDRDTRPDFASTVMIPAIQDFIKNPSDIDGLCSKIESQKKSIFGS